MIVNRMTDCNLLIKESSVMAGHAVMKCLGHVVTTSGVGPDPDKQAKIKDWPLPRTGAEMQSFLGFAQYPAPHVRHFADLTASLQAVKNDKEIIWTDSMKRDFELTKDAIQRAPYLQFPDYSRPFYIATDVSNVGMGGVLYQPKPEDNEDITPNNIVGIYSKKLSSSQVNWATYKKELGSFVYNLRYYHPYIWGRNDLVIFTDHKPLTFMLEQTDLKPVMLNWLDVILDYSFEIRYREGYLNVLPDALSRMYAALYPPGTVWGAPTGVLTIDADGTMRVNAQVIQPAGAVGRVCALATSNPFSILNGEGDATASISNAAADAMAAIDKATAEVTAAAAAAASSSATAPSSSSNVEEVDFDDDSSVVDAELDEKAAEAFATRKEWTIPDLQVEMEKRGKSIPTSTVEKVKLIKDSHERGHFGREAVFKDLFNKGYWWPHMRDDIRDEIANCDPCTRYTVVKAGFNPGTAITATGPWDHIQIDCSVHLPPTKDGYSVMLATIDVFTGFVLLRALKTTSAHDVAQALWELFCTFGPPKILQSDNGPEFVNDVIRALVKLTGVEHRLISPYNPRADGKVERSIGTVTGIIKKMLNGTDTMWRPLLPWAQYCFNSKVSSLTASTPASLMFARPLNEFKDYTVGPEPVTVSLDDWKAQQEKMMSVIYPAISDRTRTSKQAMIKKWNANRRLLLNNALPNGAIVMLIDPTSS